MTNYTAFQITSPVILEIVNCLSPHLRMFTYEELYNQFVVLNYPTENEFAIVTPENITNTWDHLETDIYLRLYQFVK